MRVMILGLLTACFAAAALPAAPAPEALVRRLGDRSWPRREDAFWALAADPSPAVTALIEAAVADPDAEIRHRARRLLLLRRYGVPAGRVADLLPILESYLASPESAVESRLFQARAMAERGDTAAARPLLALMAEAPAALRTGLGDIIEGRLGPWNEALRAGLTQLAPEQFRALKGYPGFLYLNTGGHREFVAFVDTAADYLDLDELTMLYHNLERLDAEEHLGQDHALTAIARRLFARFLDTCTAPGLGPEQALERARGLADILAGRAPDLFRELLYIMAELGDFNVALALVPEIYRKDRAGLAELVPLLKPAEAGEEYLAAGLKALAASTGDEAARAALTAVRQAWAARPEENEELHLRAAALWERLGRTGDEEAEYGRVLELPPLNSANDVDALTRLGDNQYMRLEYAEAGAVYDRALAIIAAENFSGDAVNRLRQYRLCAEAHAHMAAGRFDAALDLLTPQREVMGYSRELRIFGNLEFEIVYGRCLWKAGRLDERRARTTEVRAYYTTRLEGMEADVPRAFWLNNIAWYLARTGADTAQAIKYSEESLAVEPGNDGYLDTLAECWYAHGDRERALQFINAAIKVNSGANMLAYYRKQVTRFKAGAD
ncbi:MAG: hypothetical protein ABIF71_13380 [Planctomycetota bacterium]